MTNFAIGRRFGSPVVINIIGEETYEKTVQFLEDKDHSQHIFFALMLTPFAPADLLCYFAGISNMSLKFFLISILAGKISVLVIIQIIVEILLNVVY